MLGFGGPNLQYTAPALKSSCIILHPRFVGVWRPLLAIYGTALKSSCIILHPRFIGGWRALVATYGTRIPARIGRSCSHHGACKMKPIPRAQESPTKGPNNHYDLGICLAVGPNLNPHSALTFQTANIDLLIEDFECKNVRKLIRLYPRQL